ncbi:unnamed protein product [Cuscuta campestris]|uniref:Filament-like plant protein 4 n=1 Tax=Cuscuta campestris TaxID=132261 RepID=A0A484K9K3_9ASTE|nr:unnamed protein product [Cuscuta campestris]
MDRKSWPWKKKSSEKAAAEKIPTASASVESTTAATVSNASQGNEENYKKPKYVQISVESYSHLTGLEDQVKSYEEHVRMFEEEVKELNDKLSAAEDEMTVKDNLVKQHAKVAEEAVSGWEKAESEAATLKNHLESVTILKLTAEDRASHLDGALKECMRQIRNLKEEHEQKLHEVVLNRTKQFDKMRLELEAKISNLEQELLRSAADNSALSRSLQERSNMLVKLSEEKSRAEAEIERHKSNIESCEKEINSLKYELHVVAKELEIRNEEKNMCARSAEVANKQHLEGVKKIAKLEAECQRLRSLVRKRLPGPAALAQMKLEVESLGRDYEETRSRKSPGKPPNSPHYSPTPDYSFDNMQKFQKENEHLTERLLGMEEETKLLKEALAKRNSELQASRSSCAKTVSKLQSLEALLQANGNDHRSPSKNMGGGSFYHNASINLPSLTSMSEDGNDDTISCSGSWATSVMPELSHIKKDSNNFESPCRSDSASHLELMDDFLEMEKLAYLSNDTNGGVSSSPDDLKNIAEFRNINISSPENQPFSCMEVSEGSSPFTTLQSKISKVFESVTKEADTKKVLDDLRCVLQEMSETLDHHHPTTYGFETLQSPDPSTKSEPCVEVHAVSAENSVSVSHHDRSGSSDDVQNISQELADAIYQIHEFLMFIGTETKALQSSISTSGNGLSEELDGFSATYKDVLNSRVSLVKFVFDLSVVLSKASELQFTILGYKNSETEMSSADCIDKVALPENKIQPNMEDGYSDSASDPDIPHNSSLVPTSESTAASWKCSSEEFDQLKSEKENLEVDLGRITESLESTRAQLAETEQLLAETKSQLISAQRSNGLSETQLKCMAESYKSLETRAEKLQTEVNALQAKNETLEVELEEEKKGHQDALARCMDLQDQMGRIESLKAEIDAKTTQEKELAEAAAKLAECQETIFLLGKQLKGLRPPQAAELIGPHHPNKEDNRLNEDPSMMGFQDPDQKLGHHESHVDMCDAPFSPSDTESVNPLRSPISSKSHRPTKSTISYGQSPEKNSRGFSRFFSSKGKY